MDANKILYEYLSATGTTFKTLVGSNIFIERTNNGFDGASAKGCKFKVRGGATTEYLPTATLIVDFWCYGGTNVFLDSHAVYEALKVLLHDVNNKRTTTGTIIFSKEVNWGQNIVDPDLGWHFTLATFEITFK